MDNLLDPLNIGQSIGQQLQNKPAQDDGASVDCKKSINVLPLRYSAVYAEQSDQAVLGRIPEFTGPPVADTALEQARYTARFLREGYLYVLVKRLGTYRWENCFHVSADALLAPMDPGAPHKNSGGTSYFTINDVEDVSEGFMLFHPDPLSTRVLEQIRTQSSQRNKLQRFAFASLAHSCGGDDVIEPNALDHNVAEFAGFEDKEVGQLLQKQMFPALTDPLDENAVPVDLSSQQSRFDDIKSDLDGEKGFAVVLSDAIGITQELNNHRNDALEPLKDWMEQEDERGLSNEQHFYTSEIVRDLPKTYVDGRISSLAQREVARYRLRVGMRYMPSVRAVGEAEIGGNSQPLARDYELAEEYNQGQAEVFEQSKAQIRAQREQEFQNEYDEKYAPLLDQGARESFEARMASKSREQEALLSPRASEHLAWLKSEVFLDALDWYDERNIIWGWAYSIQVMQAIIGMDSTEQGAEQLKEWWQDINLNDRGNLAWSVYCLNQAEIRLAGTADIREFRSSDSPGADDDSGWIGPNPARIMDGFKQLTTAFNTANSALSVEAAPEWFRSGSLGITMAWYTQFMRGFFENARVGAVDRTALRVTLGLMKAQLARQATEIGIKRLWRTKGRAHELARNQRFLARDIAATLDANATQFLRFRLGVVVAIIETYSLYEALSRTNKGARDYAKITGSIMTLAAAIADTAATAVNMLLAMGRYRATDIGAAATFQLGGYSFWGGMLASVGAMFSAVDDVIEFSKALKQQKTSLWMLYISRFVANVGVAILGTALTLASSAAYLARIAEQGKSQLMRKLASLLLPLARSLATATLRGVMVSSAMVIGYAAASWAAVVLSIGLWFFSDDGLQEWCKRCVFSSGDDSDYYDDYADEIGAFTQALQDVT